ncbi:MAG: CBS domain-containing protein [Rhodocyclaceae bacterium]|nr:CBS domain-containing protein [Rhodocyclaceae bacterium]
MSTMKAERSVGGIMSPFQMVNGLEAVDSAMHIMREHGLNAILVEPNADGEWGIMTKRDVLRKIIVPGRRPGDMTVDEIANRYLITCTRDTPLLQVARQMMNNGIRRIVVMENGQPLGIVTEADLFRLVEQSGWGPGTG